MTTTQTASSAPASAGAKPAAAKATMTPLNKATTANANAKPAAAAAPAAATTATTSPLTATQLIQRLDAAKAAQVTTSSQLAQANALLKSYTDVAVAHGVTADAIATIIGKVRAAPDQVATIGAQVAQPNLCNQAAVVIKLETALAAAKATIAPIDQQLGETVDPENAAKAAAKK